MKWWTEQMGGQAEEDHQLGVDGKEYRKGEFMPFYIPRPEMPQIDEDKYPTLLKYLCDVGVEYSYRVYRPEQLQAHQRINMGHVRDMPPEIYQKDVLISQDEYVLDGNHRWWAHKERDEVLGCLVIHAEFDQAMEILFGFPDVYCYGEM
jgi:hypothetical protein